eukprot:7384629-Prymnesium_polylepis.1
MSIETLAVEGEELLPLPPLRGAPSRLRAAGEAGAAGPGDAPATADEVSASGLAPWWGVSGPVVAEHRAPGVVDLGGRRLGVPSAHTLAAVLGGGGGGGGSGGGPVALCLDGTRLCGAAEAALSTVGGAHSLGGVEALLAALAACAHLGTLSLAAVNLADSGRGAAAAGSLLERWLPQTRLLRGLSLADNALCGVTRYGGAHTTTGVEAIARGLRAAPSLTGLSLDGNRLGAAGVRALAPWPLHLVQLQLDRNSLGAAGAFELAKNLALMGPTLTALSLCDNRIGETGAEALANVLPQLARLTALRLDQNDLRGRGAAAVA